MKILIALSCAGLIAGCTMNEPLEPTGEEQAALAAELRNFEPAGQPVSCVNLRDLQGNRSAGEAAIIFDGPGGRLWVNRPAAGCPDLDFGRALKTQTTSSQLCRGDIATVFDPVTGVSYGGCGLGDFTPYTRRDG